MLRTRLLWFAVGFSVSAAAIAQFAWRDLWAQRYALFSQTSQTCDALEARVRNLESIRAENLNPAQATSYLLNTEAVDQYGHVDIICAMQCIYVVCWIRFLVEG
ncbi:hypothetical protein K2173_018267 [Erythroxylum novogranatense]|uniref:Uncharacterized protein n=1 Tax=Erythroxylum novogranatense TaxID=1862640 RepID=A0AAV8UCM3_9ROSI|nr:hypothetical protein K2173_018267 [Erythroxylum novogranatense]